MNKKIGLIAILLGLLIWLPSCDDDDDDNEATVEWRRYQDSVYNRVAAMVDESGKRVYKSISSASGMGDVYVKDSDYIANNDKGEHDKDAPVIFPSTEEGNTQRAATYASDRPNYDSDEVVIRFEGWFYTTGDVKIVFTSTEKILNANTGKWSWANNAGSAGISKPISIYIDGFRTLLHNMKVGEEKIVCIPNQLGYGAYGSSQGNVAIPGYTTIFFNVKLLKNITAERELENK